MSQGFYCYLNQRIDSIKLKKIKEHMQRIINNRMTIKAGQLSKEEAIRIFKNQGSQDKIRLFQHSPLRATKIYRLKDLYDVYAMPPFDSTGKVNLYDLISVSPGFLLLFPSWQDLSRMPDYLPQPRLARIFNEYGEWVKILGVADVADLNQAVLLGRGNEIIKVSEALHEKKIVYIADRIAREKKKIVLIAGPSSAGKTTFMKRLAVQLLVNELKPEMISVDDYFYSHSNTPRDEYGRLDFESINAVDIPLLNKHLLALIAGKDVLTPRFNFVSGRRQTGQRISLPSNGILLVEGIHCLNEKLTALISRSKKFKIYISALTQLNIDDHNRISTTDTRMIRRIVRDTHYRGYTPQGVLKQWSDVRKGEERNIYPFQEEADEMFNSALIYEP